MTEYGGLQARRRDTLLGALGRLGDASVMVIRFPTSRACCSVAVCLVLAAAGVAHAQIRVTGEVSLSGMVETVTKDGITVRDTAGKRHEVRVQGPTQQGVALSDGRLLSAPAQVQVKAEFPAAGVKPGQIVRFRCRMHSTGKVDGTISEITVLDGGTPKFGVVTLHPGKDDPKSKEPVEREVTATVKTALAKRIVVELPREQAFNKKTAITCPLSDAAIARLTTNDPARIEPGARVVKLQALQLQMGDVVATVLEVENLVAKTVADKGDDALERKYRTLSSEPPAHPRLVRSAHFAFITDVSDREWAVISEKLERMVKALEVFLGRKMTGVVEGFVARDLGKFPSGMIDDPFGVEKIRRGEGVCVNSRLGSQRHARLYSCADHGVIQHECVHGICHLAFGSTGPTWLSEGLAELGNYWKEGDRAIDLPAPVVGYLQNATPKRKLLEIAIPGRTESGTWQDYAWRWALCHLLANNPNYSKRFVPLAIELMEGKQGASFESVYGPVAREVSFEYDQFLNTLGNGYRSDLTAWPWNAKFQKLGGTSEVKVKIKAQAGWQASKVLVEEGTAYDITADGTWKIAAAGKQFDADGEADGRGRLVGAVFSDFTLSKEIPLGKKATLKPPTSGQLFLRCVDMWTELADNDGEVTVTIRRAP